jgi:hypothetical protein
MSRISNKNTFFLDAFIPATGGFYIPDGKDDFLQGSKGADLVQILACLRLAGRSQFTTIFLILPLYENALTS